MSLHGGALWDLGSRAAERSPCRQLPAPRRQLPGAGTGSSMPLSHAKHTHPCTVTTGREKYLTSFGFLGAEELTELHSLFLKHGSFISEGPSEISQLRFGFFGASVAGLISIPAALLEMKCEMIRDKTCSWCLPWIFLRGKKASRIDF